jgi:hypothetical protein
VASSITKDYGVSLRKNTHLKMILKRKWTENLLKLTCLFTYEKERQLFAAYVLITGTRSL